MAKGKVLLVKRNGKLYSLREYSHEDLATAIDSGKAGDPVQFPFLDYDENCPTDDALEIMWTFGLRRGLIVESSPHHWWFLSFTPMPIKDIFGILWHSKLIDRSHAASFLRFKRSAIRITVKAASVGYPKIRKVLRQQGGELQFYDYEAERHYREIVEETQAECLKGEDDKLEKEVKEWLNT
jgi:hypothetical protein